jgi:hypothetical protein
LVAHPARIGIAPDGQPLVHASAPTWDLELEALHAGPVSLLIENVPSAVRFAPTPVELEWLGATRVRASWMLAPGRTAIHVDSHREGPVRFAIISDLHVNLPVLERMAADLPSREIEFVACMGDLTDFGTTDELERVLEVLPSLGAPFYVTIGNHDLRGAATDLFDERLGPTNFSSLHRGVQLAMVDSASEWVAPAALSWLEQQLASRPSTMPSLVFTHIPPFDPSGIRNHAFSSRENAQRFLEILRAGNASRLFVGHIHTGSDYQVGGLPVSLTGGGGGELELFSDIGFHYLEVEVDPSGGSPLTLTRRPLDPMGG